MSEPNVPGASHAGQVNAGSRFVAVYASDPEVQNAPGVETEFNAGGNYIDRAAYGMPLSVQFAYPLHLIIASGESVVVRTLVRDAAPEDPDDPLSSVPGSFADYFEPEDVTIYADSGDSIDHMIRVNVDLAGARRFIKMDIAVVVPASGEASYAGVAVLGGQEYAPSF